MDHRAVMLQNQIDTFQLELMGKRFSSHSFLVSVAHYISNKVYGLIRPLHLTGSSVPEADITIEARPLENIITQSANNE